MEGPFYFVLIDAELEEKEGNLPILVARAANFITAN